TKKTSISHNNRTLDNEQQKNKYHKHINFDKSNENIYLEQTPIREKYEELFGEAVEKFNAKQKRADRKIDDYYAKVLKDKKLEPQREFIIQVGSIDDYRLIKDDGSPTGLTLEQIERNKQIANDILKSYYKEFQERNPNLPIYNAVIHNDEASPHMHLNVIPVATGYKRGMEKQCSFNKALKQQGIESDKENNRALWNNFRNQEVESIERLMNEHGWERKEVGTNNIKDIHEYKAIKQNERLEQLANQLELNVSLLQDIRNMDSDLREVNENHLLSHAVMEIAKTPKYSTSGKLDKRALENLYMSEVSPFDDGRLDADKFYKVHRNAIEREIDKFEKTLDVDIRKDVPKEEYKRVVSKVAVSMYANELLKGIEMLPKRLKRDEDMERAKIDYERLEREIERSNKQQTQSFDFDFS
ncbi:plasmid recombination protein, partial [Clostridium perfringens]|uniref:plasmid recombination protein n=1 Tax=Clostridium perfringens TaxID=1502 RepID=UPI003754B449